MPEPPHPKNAPGPFYVENGCCIACEAPYNEARDLMAEDGDEEFYHCYFKKQPTTPEETERAIQACRVSCVDAVRYRGNDPAILNRFIELGVANSCDLLTNGTGRYVPLQARLEAFKERLETILFQVASDPRVEMVLEIFVLPPPILRDSSEPMWDRDLDA